MSQLPDEARSVVMLHLETLSGMSKGLARTNEGGFSTEDDPAAQAELETIKRSLPFTMLTRPAGSANTFYSLPPGALDA